MAGGRMVVVAVIAGAGLLVAGCAGQLSADERTPRRAIVGPTTPDSAESEILGEGPHPLVVVGELPEKKGQTVKVHTALDTLVTPATGPSTQAGTQPAK